MVTNKGEFEEELTTERREKWIKAISRGDTESKDVLNSERVCGKHFVSGKPPPYWHKHHVDWVPTLQLGKKNFRPKLDHDANAKRAARAKKREQLAVERQEREAAEKHRKLVESSLPVAQIDFNQPNTSIKEEGNRKDGVEEAFSSHLAAVAVGEDKEIKIKNRKLLRSTPSAKLPSLTTCFRPADFKPQIRISLTLTIKFDFALGYRLWKY